MDRALDDIIGERPVRDLSTPAEMELTIPSATRDPEVPAAEVHDALLRHRETMTLAQETV